MFAGVVLVVAAATMGSHHCEQNPDVGGCVAIPDTDSPEQCIGPARTLPPGAPPTPIPPPTPNVPELAGGWVR
jgi:hypothetical protein